MTLDGRTFEVTLGPGGATVDGTRVDADLSGRDGQPLRHLIVDGRSHRLVARRDGRGWWTLHGGGRTVEVEVVDERTRTIREMAGVAGAHRGPEPIRAPMPGLVVEVEVDEGDEVRPGQGIAVVEAMKMENELRATAPGVVSRVLVSAGDAVEKGEVLVDFVAPDGDPEGGG